MKELTREQKSNLVKEYRNGIKALREKQVNIDNDIKEFKGQIEELSSQGETELELEITTSVFIDLECIKRKILEHDWKVRDAIRAYVEGLNDDEFYLIGSEEYDKIAQVLAEDGFVD